ncbi:hypothetical protein [Arthrobacter sp.]|uniref:hypothetical protein n=1 Tax=Arthrobacter sp. TaxID=1667 RepID=UPI003A92E8B8
MHHGGESRPLLGGAWRCREVDLFEYGKPGPQHGFHELGEVVGENDAFPVTASQRLAGRGHSQLCADQHGDFWVHAFGV